MLEPPVHRSERASPRGDADMSVDRVPRRSRPAARRAAPSGRPSGPVSDSCGTRPRCAGTWHPERAMGRVSRRHFLGGAGATTAAMALGAPAVHAQKGRRTLRFVAHADLRALDPVWTTAWITRNHGYLVYDTLFGTDEQLQIKPQMVERYTVSADAMTYTFTLRDGLRWHDGQPVRSEDCVESLKRWGKKD